MRCVLKRNGYEAQIDTLGAELVSLKKDNHEIMWCADPQYWGNASLVLFPFIGRNYEDTYTIQGKSYRMGIHGFALTNEFAILKQEKESLLLSLKENEKTLENYPFRFELRIAYVLEDDGLSVSFEVINDSDETLPFSLGFH
ncbi:MAG: aldose 1-epimerase family protein, partial [Erysipelotrichaceae bacterium]|nr:aldose 1-epimerase family protein [Erysipelotrichaceae bacterium]